MTSPTGKAAGGGIANLEHNGDSCLDDKQTVLVGYQVKPRGDDLLIVAHSVPQTVPEPFLGLLVGRFHLADFVREAIVKSGELDTQRFCDVLPQNMLQLSW
jgi:hypothetical protein